MLQKCSKNVAIAKYFGNNTCEHTYSKCAATKNECLIGLCKCYM